MLKLSAFFGTLLQYMIFFCLFSSMGVRCIFHTLAKKNFTKACQHTYHQPAIWQPNVRGPKYRLFLLRHQSTLLDGQHLVFQIVKTTIKIIVGDPDPYLWPMDPDPDPTPDPTPFFFNFKDAKKKKNSYFFILLAHRHIIFSLKNLIFG